MRKEIVLGLGAFATGFVLACGSGEDDPHRSDVFINPLSPPTFAPAGGEAPLPGLPLVEDHRSFLPEVEVGEPICLVWPVYGQISQYVGSGHPGIDIDQRGKSGEPVVAAADGEVELAAYQMWGFGHHIILKHGDNDEWETVYGHMDDLDVEEGQKVVAGQLIGTVGSTGYSTGPHVHFEVKYEGKNVNPLDFLPIDTYSECQEYK